MQTGTGRCWARKCQQCRARRLARGPPRPVCLSVGQYEGGSPPAPLRPGLPRTAAPPCPGVLALTTCSHGRCRCPWAGLGLRGALGVLRFWDRPGGAGRAPRATGRRRQPGLPHPFGFSGQGGWQSFAAPRSSTSGVPKSCFLGTSSYAGWGTELSPAGGGANRKAPSWAPCPCPCHPPPAKGTGTPPASRGAIRPRPRRPPGAPWHRGVRGTGLGCPEGAKFGFGVRGGRGVCPPSPAPLTPDPAPGCL